jgi:hypothetical protein
MSNNEIKHYGILGMKWGVRRSKNLSNKYGVKVGVGVSKKQVNNAFKATENKKKELRNRIISDYSYANRKYINDELMGLNTKSDTARHNKLRKKVDKLLKEVDTLSVSEIVVRKESGKKYIDVILGNNHQKNK